ncbi:MAG TPA: threonine--tRNA ligase, partial [Candidatus Paceibacterota bacterium]|nr:threonine--tRNA ligase [Candidatus Paceibacterota bacterium]
MTEAEKIHNLRHSLAHLLAAAALEHHPGAKLTLGPAIENGFYYDIDFGKEKITEEDLGKLEKAMKKILPDWKEFSHREVSAEEARKIFAGNE